MRKLFAAACAALWSVATLQAQPAELRFRDDGTFRIAQFTDMHLDPSKPRRLAESEKTFARLERVLTSERPDLVVFTGDVVTAPGRGMWRRLLDAVERHGIPFCVVLGNHDAEQDLARTEIARIVTSYDGSLNRLADNGELADVELTVAGRGSDRPAWAFYCLDSHDYSTIEGIDGYGWFLPGQVEWLRACCTARTEANGGRPLPSLAFLPHRAAGVCGGVAQPRQQPHRPCCRGRMSRGAQHGDVLRDGRDGQRGGYLRGTRPRHRLPGGREGHLSGLRPLLGRQHDLQQPASGVRMLVLTEGVRGFETWIREDDGRMVDHARFDEGKITEISVER